MTERPTAVDNITISVYDAAEAPTAEAAREAEPEREETFHNTTRVKYHEEIIAALGGTTPDIDVDKLVLGDDDSDTSTLADSDLLGNETLRVGLTDEITDGQTYTASIFLDSTQGNGNTFREAALIAEQSPDLPINRVVLDDPGGLLDPKSSTETVTIDIDITQQDA